MFKMKYVDSHAHYSSKRFKKDRDLILNKVFSGDVSAIIECGTNSFWNQKTIELCNQYDKVYGVIGFYPTNIEELKLEKTIVEFKEQLKHPKILGIGEIGLDYYHSPETKEEQIKYFNEQLDLAYELNMPVCIHSRQAEEDTVKVLKNAKNRHGVIHCYSYGTKSMGTLCSLGYYFGIGGTSTYLINTELREAIKNMPLERIVLETDAPYLTPEIVRKEKNDSSKIIYVIEEISKLKGISKEEIIEQTNKNIQLVYPKIKL